MAALRRRLAAEEHGRRREFSWVEPLINPTVGHQAHELLLVLGPAAAVLLQSVKHLLSRRQGRLVRVLRADNRSQEVGEVVTLRESGQLRDVVQANVNEAT